jgi:hypothetical protein
VAWRPSFECELAVVSNAEFSTGSNPDLAQGQDNEVDGGISVVSAVGGDAVEIWDVRRGWAPKWSVTGSAAEGGVTGQSVSLEPVICCSRLARHCIR